MTSGGARDVWARLRSNIVSFLSDTVRPAASKTVTTAVIILAPGVLDADGLKERFSLKNPHTQVGPSRFSFLAGHVCAARARKDDSRRRIVCGHTRQHCVAVFKN